MDTVEKQNLQAIKPFISFRCKLSSVPLYFISQEDKDLPAKVTQTKALVQGRIVTKY